MVRIKICGVTCVEDAVLAARLGADALGLNFHPASPRCIDQNQARAILDSLPPFVTPVGVFVDPTLEAMATQVLPLGRLRMLQRHGPPAVECPFGFTQIVPFALRGPETLQEIQDYLLRCQQVSALPSAILIDAFVPGQVGGTGQTAPWQLLEGFRPGVPWILAGGLKLDNVREAICRLRPDAVDVASGVEGRPGRKDPEKLRRFIDQVRLAEHPDA